MNPEPAENSARIGVLLGDDRRNVDAILADVVAGASARGVAVGGLLQRFGERLPSGKRAMFLRDIGSGEELRLDQPRGAEAHACVLNPDALARAACLLRDATRGGFELLLVNRFGIAEAEGQGLRAEFAEAVCSGARVLVAVRPGHFADLVQFLGEAPHLLAPDAAAILDWASGS